MKIREALREGSHIAIYREGKKNAVLCESVKAGLVWPETLENPTYYCIFGQSPMPNKKGKKPLKFLTEAQEALPNKLYEKLILDSRRLLCWDYFADFTHEKNLDFYQGFDRFMAKRDFRINLHPASVVSYTPGLLVIRDWIDNEALLDIPGDSALGQQLGEIRKTEQGQEKKNYAVDALRCVIGSFDIQPALGRVVHPAKVVY